MWLTRITKFIRQSHEPLLVEECLYGISEVANALLTPEGHTYWIEFQEQGTDSLVAGHWGFPEEFNIQSLSQAVRLHSELVHQSLRPIVILTRIENALDDVCALITDLGEMRQVLLLCGSAAAVAELGKRHGHLRRVKSEFLNVTEAEAMDSLGIELPGNGLASLHDEIGVTYEAVRKSAYSRLGLESPLRPTPGQYNSVPACLSKGRLSVVQILVNNRQWKRALDVAIATRSPELIDIIDYAGEDAIHRGELESFRRKLDGLPAGDRAHDRVVYWQLVSEASSGITTGLLNEIRPWLLQKKLPRVQLLLKLLGQQGDQSLVEQESAEEDPAQAMYLAHLQSFSGSASASIRSLRRLMDRFQISGSTYRFVQTMLLLTNSLILNGSYKDATYWGRIALDKAIECKSDELEVAVATASLAYAHILSGNPEDAAELLSSVPEAAGFVGLPYAEGIISTMADQFALSGHYATALSWYEYSVSKSVGPPADIVAADIAMMLVRLGRTDEAEARSWMRMETLEEGDDALPWLQLAAAVSAAPKDSNRAINMLTAMLHRPDSRLSGPFLARASISLALLLYRKQRFADAFLCLTNAKSAVSELGDSGWILMSGNAPDVLSLMREWQSMNSPLSIRFLGDDYWEFQSINSLSLGSKRIRELMLILSCFPNGLSSEELADLMGWGPEAKRTVRSHMRHLREIVPIASGPYRLTVKVDADYLDLEQAIAISDVEGALNVYGGPLLGQSDVPFIREHRLALEVRLRILVVDQGSPEQIALLASRLRDDMELLELAMSKLPTNSVMRPQIEAQLNLLRRAWSGES